MHITLHKEVSEKYPDLRVEFIEVHNIQDYTSDEERKEAEQEIVEAVLSTFPSKETLEAHPFKNLYQTFYQSMGLKVKKVSTPIKQALRIFTNKSYRSLYKILDTCMKIEYTTLISFQLYDIDKISGELEYRLADGTETLTTFHNEEKTCKPGELILTDSEGVLHSVYYGNNKNKSIDSNTKNCVIRIMGVPGTPEEDFQKAVTAFKAENKL